MEEGVAHARLQREAAEQLQFCAEKGRCLVGAVLAIRKAGGEEVALPLVELLREEQMQAVLHAALPRQSRQAEVQFAAVASGGDARARLHAKVGQVERQFVAEAAEHEAVFHTRVVVELGADRCRRAEVEPRHRARHADELLGQAQAVAPSEEVDVQPAATAEVADERGVEVVEVVAHLLDFIAGRRAGGQAYQGVEQVVHVRLACR